MRSSDIVFLTREASLLLLFYALALASYSFYLSSFTSLSLSIVLEKTQKRDYWERKKQGIVQIETKQSSSQNREINELRAGRPSISSNYNDGH